MAKNSTAAERPEVITVPWWRRVGPGLVTACVVIGPGSILASSRVGANYGYQLLWVVLVSSLLMVVAMTLGARLGSVASASPCDLLRRKAGAAAAASVGLGIFFICTAYQASNNFGVTSAFETWVSGKHVLAALLIVFNGLAVAFLYAFRNLYRSLEKLMMAFVAVMLASFLLNLFFLRPDPAAVARGLFPSLPQDGDSGDHLAVLALVGTTFSIAAAFYQAYLVRQKGWTVRDLRTGLRDARIGTAIMFLITVMLMSTAAAGLFTGEPVELSSAVEVAEALRPAFGETGRIVFCVGLFSAGYSSFLVNAMIGGFMAADGLNLGSRVEDIWPRRLTVAALMAGMLVGLAVIYWEIDRTPSIIAAQAVTVVLAPLIAAALLWLTASRDVMGDQRNGWFLNTAGAVALLVLIVLAGKTALIDLPGKISDYRTASVEKPAEPNGKPSDSMEGNEESGTASSSDSE